MSDFRKLLQCLAGNQFPVFFQMGLSRRSESTTISILRENVADFVKILRSTGGLMYNQLVKGIFIFIKSVDTIIEAVQPMSCCNDIIQGLEGVKPYQIYRNLPCIGGRILRSSLTGTGGSSRCFVRALFPRSVLLAG